VTRAITIAIFLSSPIAFSTDRQPANNGPVSLSKHLRRYETIVEIPVPKGFERTIIAKDAFGSWLRHIRVRKDSRVHLYDGRLKTNQSAQFAVLDVVLSKGDLQQCADAIMRLKAEYLFARNDMDAIHFIATDGTELSFARWLNGERYTARGNKLSSWLTIPSHQDKRTQLERFLEVVFTYCGTLSLEKETRRVDLNELQTGDVFVKGGSPGHAMIVVDAAVDGKGKKIFMLAQSYMPAQDIHIVKNPLDLELSPWYEVNTDSRIITPEWIFYSSQLRRW
jgi:hypothetical protein